MDSTVIGLFLVATFFGGVTTGVAGFALGLVVSGVWLHILSPLQTATLIVGFGLISQAYGTWAVRHALDWRRFMPFVLGSMVGVPIGIVLLGYASPTHLRAVVGSLLVLYSTYGLARPALKPFQSTNAANIGVGLLNGILGGMTGLAGVIVTVWCQLQGWSKDAQRAVFQPANFATFVMAAAWLTVATDAVTATTTKLYLIGLPVFFVAMWIGVKLYGQLDETAFRRLVLILLLLSGLSLLATFAWPVAAPNGG